MVVLSEDPAELEERGFGVKQLSGAYRTIAREHGMPIDTSERPRMAASLPACEAVVAARLHAPEQARAAAALAADPQLRRRAAGRAGDDRGRRARRRPRPRGARRVDGRATTCVAAVEEDKALRAGADARRARARPQARELVGRDALHVPELRDRALERRRPDRRARLPAVRGLRRDPGQPRARPRAPRPAARASRRCSRGRACRWPPRRSRWSAGLEVCEAREALGRVATERHVGADGFWSL